MKEGTTYMKGVKGCYLSGRDRLIIVECLTQILRNADSETKGRSGIQIGNFFLKNEEYADKIEFVQEIQKKLDY